MNVLAGWCLLFLNEEDSFWMLSRIVEDTCAGYYSQNMQGVRVCSLVYREY